MQKIVVVSSLSPDSFIFLFHLAKVITFPIVAAKKKDPDTVTPIMVTNLRDLFSSFNYVVLAVGQDPQEDGNFQYLFSQL